MKLSEIVLENLMDEWIYNEPSNQCFDYNEARMASLLNFIKRKEETARQHLIICPRCRFIYLCLRTTHDYA